SGIHRLVHGVRSCLRVARGRVRCPLAPNAKEPMMAAPADRKYLDSHEWHKLEGKIVTLGITDFAVDELTDLTYVELPLVGAEVNANESIGEIESVKATSELYTGVSGKVIEVNAAAAQDPAVVNEDPFG